MADRADRPKKERFEEFLRRLAACPPAATAGEAYGLLAAVLIGVEDELTSIPYDPAQWQTDGRMYPPLEDSVREVPEHTRVKRYRSRAHNTFIGENGSIEIRTASGDETLLTKPGADGKGIWEP